MKFEYQPADLEMIPFSIDNHRLELYALKNWESYFEQALNHELNLSNFPYWIKVWDAEIVLTEFLYNLGFQKPLKILELGAGMGLAGLFAGVLGHQVTITDYKEEALSLLKINVAQNRLEKVFIRQLDWNHADMDEKFDIICGSELLYNESAIKPICNIIEQCIKPEGRIIMAHEVERSAIDGFVTAMQSEYRIQSTIKSLSSDKKNQQIIVQSLSRKSLS